MRIIPLGSLLKPGKAFERARAGVREHRGQANVWIFPFYSGRYVFDPAGDLTPEFARGRLAGMINYAAYRRFSALLEQTMRNELLPLFVFIDPRDKGRTGNILDHLRPNAAFVVHVPTQTDFAVPTLGKDGQGGPAWQVLAGIMGRLGVKAVDIFGELGFHYRHRPAGCVYTAEQNLASRLSASVTVQRELTFPNIDLATAA